MPGTKKSWSDLSDAQKGAVIAAGVAEIILTTVALRDLRRRPSSGVRGPKALWVLAMAIQPVGPLGYLGLGRKKAASTDG